MNKRKSILVTSGSKRLGKYISKFFVMNDWDLILHYNKSKVDQFESLIKTCNIMNLSLT